MKSLSVSCYLAILKAILDRTGYSLDVTTGQRKYGGPPPDWKGAAPGNGCEVSNWNYYLTLLVLRHMEIMLNRFLI